MGVSGQRHAPAALSPEQRPGTHCIGCWMGPRAGLDVCGKSRPPTGIRSPDRPAHSESLYRLSYPGPPKATRSFVIPQRPSVCMKQHLSDGKDCREILCQVLLLKSVDTVRLCLQSDRKKTLHTFLYCIFIPTTAVLLCEVRTEAEETFDDLSVTF